MATQRAVRGRLYFYTTRTKRRSEKFIKSNKQEGGGGGQNKRGVGFLLFLQLKFGDLLQNLPANVFYELLEGKIVENKKAKFSHAKQIFFTFFRNTNEYEY